MEARRDRGDTKGGRRDEKEDEMEGREVREGEGKLIERIGRLEKSIGEARMRWKEG